ncbi:Graves disease carrier protein [Strongyloides ratti]|uniref:Graves disease carrier protein n=1 Tax=Strongyloides ratti TaxID=34506 RepID=A0A090LF40_STRRB|nr:Graves disease carrier protein [Strongyloides ratti]CEF68411.1 Graves disease carrier protein [Strongyloides ratti]
MISSDSKKNFNPYVPFLVSAISGGVAGAVAKTVIAPMDRTKINFQVDANRRYSTRAALNFIIKTFQTEGFFALFRGNSATMLRVIPFATFQYASYEEYKKLFEVDKDGKRTPLLRYVAGSCAATTATCLTFPLDTLKAWLSVINKKEYNGILDLCKKKYNCHGIEIFYRGITPALIGVIPYAGSSFFTYETLKIWYKDEFKNEPPGYWRMAFGGLSGAIGQTASYPFDIVRRRMQTGKISKNQNIFKSLLLIIKNEGIIGGIFKGLSMNWIKGPMAVGISLTLYDTLHLKLKELYVK